MVQAFATSDVGREREINEDYFYISFPDDQVQLFILADGMGGYQGGEIASKLAVSAAKSYIMSNYENTNKEEKEGLADLVKNALQYANMIVYEKAEAMPELSNMGTTMDICIIYQSKAFIAHVGDSRVYRLRKEFFRKITKDHSYVQKLVDEGKITKEESEVHPKKNMLMKAVGCNAYVEPDVLIKGFLKGDVILMCSDGLTNMVTQQTIFEIASQKDIEQATVDLVKLANDNGGYDNITAILIKNI